MVRPLLVVGVFLAGSAIGAAASWLILDDGGMTIEAPRVSPATVLPAPVPPAVPARPQSREVVAPIVARSLKEVTGGFEEYASGPVVGTGKISGVVRTDEGVPLPGVVIRAEFQGDRGERLLGEEWKRGDGPPAEKDMQEQVREFMEEVERSRAMRREATTAKNGEFTLDGLLDDRYSVEAYLQGWTVVADQRNLQHSAHPGVWVDFTASPVIVVPVDVVLPDGTQPRKATFSLERGSSSSGEVWRPARPEIRVGAGAYTITATAGDHSEWRSEPQDVVLREGVEPAPLTFRLAARTGIKGRVKVPKGYALDSVSIYALRCSGSTVPAESALMAGQNQWASQWNGYEFQFQDLSAGKWALGAGSWEGLFTTTTVDVTEGTITEVILEITDAGAGGLTVHVVGPGNVPVTDARVNVSRSGNPWEGREDFTARPKKDGAWVVQSKKETTEGDWMISVQSERFGQKAVAMPKPLAGELRIEMAEPASLEVTVPGYAGSGLEGRLRVNATPLHAGAEQQSRYVFERGDQFGPEGRQTIKPLQPGRYRVTLQYQRERWQTSPLERVDVDVAPGSNAISIPAPPVYSLTIVVPDAPDDTRVNLMRTGTQANEWHHSARVGSDGTATVEGLVAGTYRASVFFPKGRRAASMTVTVPAAGPVTFTEQTETRLVVKTADGDGYLASVGIQPGDVIVGAGNILFDGSRSASQVLRGLMMARKTVTLSVAKDGKTSEVAVDSEKFLGATQNLQSLEGR